MEIFPLVDEQTVLRVPRRTEQQLIEKFGSSGRKALATGHEVSVVTETELRDLESVAGYIGAFVPDTAPFADLDLEGNFRYYSLQRRVRITQDLRVCTRRLGSFQSRHSLERFIRDVRDMTKHLGLIPDLAGTGNLVLDQYDRVKLVDINNFRRLIGSEELDKAIPNDVDWEPYALRQRSVAEILPPGYVDDLGHPIADLSLAALQNLEVRALGRERKALRLDPFYQPLTEQKRRILLALLRGELA
jgi:hypothetical protein